MLPPRHQRKFLAGAALVVLVQTALGLFQVADAWTRGHNGWNTAAFHLAARNTLRFGVLFPARYHTGVAPPAASDLYGHHPLAMHLHDVVAVHLLSDHVAACRLVAASQGAFLVVALLALVRRFFDPARALLTATLYVLSPINAIFINMANHEEGCIAWLLVCLYAYLSIRETPAPSRWQWAALYASYAAAAAWNWPANYVALVIVVHWIATARAEAGACARWRRLIPAAAFCVWVLALFSGQLLLAATGSAGLGDLASTLSERTGSIGRAQFLQHLRVVPELMFTYPVLALAAAWLLAFPVRLARRRLRPGDLMPVAFAFAGILHYWLFEWSAWVHEYWAWTALPFVAFAVADTLVAAFELAARRSPSRARIAALAAATVLAAAVLAPYLLRAATLVPEGRRVGGSMWFVAPTRGGIETYDSGRSALDFAAFVRDRTSRATGVLVHRSIETLRPEPRFDATLDRERVPTRRLDQAPPAIAGVERWVLIALTSAATDGEWRRLARDRTLVRYGDFTLLELDSRTGSIELWELRPRAPSWWWRFFVSPFEPPVGAVRKPAPGAGA